MSPPNALVVDIRSAWRPGMAYVIGVSIITTKRSFTSHQKESNRNYFFLDRFQAEKEDGLVKFKITLSEKKTIIVSNHKEFYDKESLNFFLVLCP